MVQSTEHSFAAHSIALGKPVSMLRSGRQGVTRGGDTRSQAHVNAAVIVMEYPTVENVFEMTLPQRDQEIQAFPTNRGDQTFANRVRFGRLPRGPQHTHTHSGYGPIQFPGENAVPVMDQEPNVL